MQDTITQMPQRQTFSNSSNSRNKVAASSVTSSPSSTASAKKNPNAALNDVEAKEVKISDKERKAMVQKIDQVQFFV